MAALLDILNDAVVDAVKSCSSDPNSRGCSPRTSVVKDEDDSEYESDDGQWHPPFHDAETGEYHKDVYGTLSETASTIVSPDGIAKRFLEMVGTEKLQEIKLFVDIGCGKGKVTNAVASILGCQTVGIDILKEELDVATTEAQKGKVDHLTTYAICDFLEFDTVLPDVQPNEILFYTYLIPKMVSNKKLREKVEMYLGNGSTFVTWSYHATPEWPCLKEWDQSYNIKMFQKQQGERDACDQ